MPQSPMESLEQRKPGYSLDRAFYRDDEHYALDLEHIWYREWVFAGHVCELKQPGDFLTLQIGDYSLMVIRGDDGVIRALHNVCRHRGFRICDDASGSVKRRIVCPYHQWSYSLDGALAKARSMEPDFEPSQHHLGTAACELVDGMIFVCVADNPPEIEPMRQDVAAYLAPFDLLNAKVAYETTFVEHGNWKLVMENNRECFHCKAHHSELCAVFPEAPLHSGGGSDAEVAAMDLLIERAEDAGLPGRYLAAPDFQYRVMRMPLLPPARSMTADGKPAVAKQFGSLPAFDIGDVLLYHYPSTWNHFVADHAVTFRILPLSPTTTELRTTWLVPGDAVEGVDYDVDILTSVWLSTNAQDTALVERAQRGVTSPAYRPGPYSLLEEEGVMQFVDWYSGVLSSRLKEDQ
jgi:phenylpropionate dioxygenase-like ring-hydroxylating dioxygenase large terminal subunit